MKTFGSLLLASIFGAVFALGAEHISSVIISKAEAKAVGEQCVGDGVIGARVINVASSFVSNGYKIVGLAFDPNRNEYAILACK